MPARITAVSTRPEVRASNEWLSSSMANTTPASGVLNAAATPAPRRRPAPWRGRRPRAAERSRRPIDVHDGGADLHGRALAPDRGAAGQPQHGQQDLAHRDPHRQRPVHQRRGSSSAAPRSPGGCRCPARRETASGSAARSASGHPAPARTPSRAARRSPPEPSPCQVGRRGEQDGRPADQDCPDPEPCPTHRVRHHPRRMGPQGDENVFALRS